MSTSLCPLRHHTPWLFSSKGAERLPFFCGFPARREKFFMLDASELVHLCGLSLSRCFAGNADVLLLLEQSPVPVEAQVQVPPAPAGLATFLLRKTFHCSIHTNPSGRSYTLTPRATQFLASSSYAAFKGNFSQSVPAVGFNTK